MTCFVFTSARLAKKLFVTAPLGSTHGLRMYEEALFTGIWRTKAQRYDFYFELPNIPETYIHRIGRTGRAGASGIALSFCDTEEREYLRDIHKLISKPIPVVEDHPYHAANPVTVHQQPAHRRSTPAHGRSQSNGRSQANGHSRKPWHGSWRRKNQD